MTLSRVFISGKETSAFKHGRNCHTRSAPFRFYSPEKEE
jgi:hypothetical protein